MFTVFYHSLKWLVLLILPIGLVFGSINLQIVDNSLHKNTLKSDQFYSQLSGEIKAIKNSLGNQATISNLINMTVVDTISSPKWLQNTTEQNIDLTTAWLDNKTDTWSYYLPTKELDLAVKTNIDLKSNEIAEKNLLQIPNCTQQELLQITKVGFDSTKPLCLSEAVKNRTQSFGDFVGLTPDRDSLRFLMRDSKLSSSSDTFSMIDLKDSSSDFAHLYQTILNIRTALSAFRSSTVPLIMMIICLFGILIILGFFSRLNILAEFKQMTRIIGINSIIFSIIFVVICGGLSLFSSSFTKILPMSLNSNSILILLTKEFTKISYTLVEPSIFAGKIGRAHV